MILQKLKADAEAYLGETVDSAVITVPGLLQRRPAPGDQGRRQDRRPRRQAHHQRADRGVARVRARQGGADQTILVFDLGGGTFDVSVLEIGDGVFEVKATAGDNHLGGDNFDKAIVDWMVAEFKASQGIDLSQDKMALQRLYEAAEKAKVELSTTQETQINLPFITADQSGPKHLDMRLTRVEAQRADRRPARPRCRAGQAGARRRRAARRDIDHVVLVGGMTRMPAVQEKVKELTGKDPHRGVNPDEVVAVGAAIQAGVLAGDVKDVLLLDVTPLTLGIETKGGVMTKLIERNTTIPTRKSEIFSTAEDNQPSVEVHVLQGEREMATYNKSLGKFQLTGIPPAPRGMPQIEVTFDIDANGILNVSAKDLGTGKEQKIEIKAGSGLSDDEIERMVKDAESHADDDRRLRELVEARNNGENAAYQAESSSRSWATQVDESSKAEIEAAIKDVRGVLESEDAERDPVEDRRAADGVPRGVRADVRSGPAAAGGRPANGAARRRRRRRPAGRGGGRRRRGRGRPGAVGDDEIERPRSGGVEPARRPTSRGEQSGEEESTSEEPAADEDAPRQAAAGRARRVPRARAAHAGRLRELPQARRRDAAHAGERAEGELVRELLPVARQPRARAHIRRARTRSTSPTGCGWSTHSS